jgi:hypothetical protein
MISCSPDTQATVQLDMSSNIPAEIYANIQQVDFASLSGNSSLTLKVLGTATNTGQYTFANHTKRIPGVYDRCMPRWCHTTPGSIKALPTSAKVPHGRIMCACLNFEDGCTFT